MSLKFLVHAWGLWDSVEQIFRNKALWLLLFIKYQGVIVMKILKLLYFFLFYFILFIYWLHWVFVALCGLSLVAESRSYSCIG